MWLSLYSDGQLGSDIGMNVTRRQMRSQGHVLPLGTGASNLADLDTTFTVHSPPGSKHNRWKFRHGLLQHA